MCIYFTVDQVWNRPFSNNVANQAANLLNRNSRSSTHYPLPQHQPTTTLNHNVAGEAGQIPSNTTPTSYLNNDNAIFRPSSFNAHLRPNLLHQSEMYDIPRSFHQMSPPSPNPPHAPPIQSRNRGLENKLNSFSGMALPSSAIEPNVSTTTPPPVSGTVVDVLPTEITCPACILQV